MSKEDLFSKLNIKDFNNKLEEILEKKSFSEGTKNILLNILYKIENAYDDYRKVKVKVESKKDFIEEVIKNIEDNCDIIEIVKPKLNEKTKLADKNFIVDKELKKIISYPNEKYLFYALNNLKKDIFILNTKYETLKEPMENLLNRGYIDDREEIIRDFDGWTWNIISDEIENYIYNLVFQNIKILLGNEFLKYVINDNQTIDFISEFEKSIYEIYNEEKKFDIAKLIYQIAILEYIKNDKNKKENILNIKNLLNIELNKMNNKKQYLQEIASIKKKIGKDIKQLDEIINNNKLLRESFIEENKNLEESKQVFSLSEYSDILQKRRAELMIQLDDYSDSMKPMNFVKKKEEISKKYEILNEIKYDLIEEEISELIIRLQKNFLKMLNEKLKSIQLKKEILEYIYLFRYYKLIYINEKEQIKDVKELLKEIRNTEKHLITKACKLKVINILCQDIEENYKLVSEILSYNIIDLEDINLEFKKQDNNISLTIYDDGTIEDTIYCEVNKELNVKFNKKIRLFN